jgi:ACR3 family arsenite transporter
LVAFNSILQIVLYAPMGTFFINIIQPSSDMDVESYRNGMESNMPQSTTHDIDIHYSTVATSVAVFLGIPLGAAILTRFIFIFVLKQKNFFNKVFLPLIGPLSLIGLLFTTLIIFAAQGNKVSFPSSIKAYHRRF